MTAKQNELKQQNKTKVFHVKSKIGLLAINNASCAFVSTITIYDKNESLCIFPMCVFRTQESEKADKKLGKKKKPKKLERLEVGIEEEAGEEVEGGWEKVKGGAPLVKVNDFGIFVQSSLMNINVINWIFILYATNIWQNM